jgi:hypothetical protein
MVAKVVGCAMVVQVAVQPMAVYHGHGRMEVAEESDITVTQVAMEVVASS